VWTVTTKPFKGAHYATFPPDLIEPCILAGCPENGTVLDPFGGSGTTGLVAKRSKRNAILIELNENYVTMAKNRINET
jgi:DNA modification methylase